VARRLGELLVDKGECPRAAVEEALRAQAVFGGRLGTNLLEIGAITEERLANALGERHHVPALHGDLLPEPEALDLITSNDADRWEVVPLRAPARKLVLLTMDPGNLAVLDEVAFATGRSVHPFVVPEARLWRLLARSYGLFREERGIDHHPHAAGARTLSAGAGQDLIDEAGFDALYGRVGLTTPPPFPAIRTPPQSPAAPGLVPPPVPRPVSPPAPRPVVVPEPVGVDEPEPSPLSFREAVRFLEGVEERGAIARTVLRYARSRFRRAVLLTVRRGQAHGWVGLGEGVRVEAVRRLRLPLASEGVVATVVSTRSHFLGPLARTEANVRLLKELGGGVPKSAFVIPLLALGRVVNVLYADNGRGELVDPTDLGELLILATRIAQGYEALARRAV
jgi:Type II secretion system (T2SS), protein E, N-terminal domain